MQNDKLLPCPFCGGEAEVQNPYPKIFMVWCKDCRIGTTNCQSRKQAISKWNTRKPMERIVGEIALLERKQKKIMRETGINSEVFEVVRVDEYVKLDEVLDIVKGGVDNAG